MAGQFSLIRATDGRSANASEGNKSDYGELNALRGAEYKRL